VIAQGMALVVRNNLPRMLQLGLHPRKHCKGERRKS
jgi:hypothetical protein